jgi:hypothetical protein
MAVGGRRVPSRALHLRIAAMCATSASPRSWRLPERPAGMDLAVQIHFAVGPKIPLTCSREAGITSAAGFSKR